MAACLDLALKTCFFPADQGAIGGKISKSLWVLCEQCADAVDDGRNIFLAISEFITLIDGHINIIARRPSPPGDHAAAADRGLTRDAILAWMSSEINIDLRLRQTVFDLALRHVFNPHPMDIRCGLLQFSRERRALGRIIGHNIPASIDVKGIIGMARQKDGI